MGLSNPLHLMMIMLVLLLVFGAKRLPEMGRGLGDGLRTFREAVSGDAHTSTLTLAETHSEPVGESAVAPVAASTAPATVPAGE